MLALGFACLALLATATNQADLPVGLGRWFLTETPPYDPALEEKFLLEELYEPEIPPADVFGRGRTPATTALPLVLWEEDAPVTVEEHPDPIGEDGGVDEAGSVAVWTMVLVAGVLLASVLGSVALGYYLCVWRGGRVHYQRQKQSLLNY